VVAFIVRRGGCSVNVGLYVGSKRNGQRVEKPRSENSVAAREDDALIGRDLLSGVRGA